MENRDTYRNKSGKLIMLVGAGASRDIGYSTLDGLLKQAMIGYDEIDQLIRNTHTAINAQRNSSAVFEELIVQLKDYKKIANALRTDYVLADVCKPNSNIMDVEAKFSKALTKCYRILVQSYGPNVIDKNKKEFTFIPELFSKIATLSEDKVIDIYTTNYDCSYQVLASSFGNISFMTHISNEDGVFRDNWYDIRKDLAGKCLPRVYIHRLHGCVAWYNIPDEGPSHTAEKHGSGGKEEISFNDNELHNMCIKLVAAQLLGTNRVFASAFDEFNHQLESNDILLAWGYSFRDLEVTRQINQALIARQGNPFKIYYIDPYLSEYAVLENIRNTLRKAPIQISGFFKPKQINWIPSDGRDRLAQIIIAIAKEEYDEKE